MESLKEDSFFMEQNCVTFGQTIRDLSSSVVTVVSLAIASFSSVKLALIKSKVDLGKEPIRVVITTDKDGETTTTASTSAD